MGSKWNGAERSACGRQVIATRRQDGPSFCTSSTSVDFAGSSDTCDHIIETQNLKILKYHMYSELLGSNNSDVSEELASPITDDCQLLLCAGHYYVH